MKKVQFTSKLRLFISSLIIAGLFSSQLAVASDSETDWFAIRGTNPFLLLHENSGTSEYWYLWHNRSNLPTNGVGLGYFSSGSYIFPFIAEMDAPVNSLYLAQGGLVGINTNTPASSLHVTNNLSFGPATMRLQGTDLVFVPLPPALPTPTTSAWDVNGGRTQFGIEDVTMGHNVFKIESGSSEDTLVLRREGGVASEWSGMNSGGDGLKKLVALSANNADSNVSSDAGFTLRNERANFLWNFRTAEFVEGFMATKEGSKGPELQISNPTNDYRNVSMQLGNGASCTSTGQWLNASSRDYKENIRELTGGEVMEAFRQLKPVSYNFKKDENKDATIGFIAEDVPNLVATEDRKGLNSLEIVALLTKVVQEQQTQIEAQQKAIQQLEDKFQTSQTVLPPSATLTGWQPMNQQQVPGSL